MRGFAVIERPSDKDKSEGYHCIYKPWKNGPINDEHCGCHANQEGKRDECSIHASDLVLSEDFQSRWTMLNSPMTASAREAPTVKSEGKTVNPGDTRGPSTASAPIARKPGRVLVPYLVHDVCDAQVVSNSYCWMRSFIWAAGDMADRSGTLSSHGRW